MLTLEQIEYGQAKLQAAVDCGNLMMGGSALLTANLTRDYVATWANRDDCQLAMPWGCYDGIEGVTRCYTQDFMDINDEGAAEYLKGSLRMDTLSSEVIEVADDLQTARATYVLHGITNNPSDLKEVPENSYKDYWEWGRIGVDFINEDGTWKIWHMRVYYVFKYRYMTDWAEQPYNTKFEWKKVPAVDHPPLPCYAYNINEVYPNDQPALPEPYKTFADVAPGYGY